MPKLYLLRHLKSQWNYENRFAGWVDNPLSQEGKDSANAVREKIKGFSFDEIYTSPLVRNKETTIKVLEGGTRYPLFMHLTGKMAKWGNFAGDGNFVPVYVTEELNERYYGRLQGMNREEAKKEFGEEQFNKWRRGYGDRPPGGESLKDTFNRTIPFYKKNIEKGLKEGKNILIITSHNALRSIAKHIENLSDEDIVNLEIPYGGIIEYDLKENLSIASKKEIS